MSDIFGFFSTEDRVFEVLGEKKAEFLHGQFTNSITGLADNSGSYNLFLSLKGKVRADLFVLQHKNRFLLIIPQDFSELVTDHLKKIAVLSRCEIKDISKQYVVCHVLGGSTSILPQMEYGQAQDFECNQTSVIVFRTDRLGKQGCDVLCSPQDLKRVLDFLQSKKYEEIDFVHRELIRIRNGIAKVGQDAQENHLPQEANLRRALDFNKGCYLGQETVARLENRGHINKILACMSCKEAGITVGSDIRHQGKTCGSVTSVVEDKSDGMVYLLGYLPVELNKRGTELLVAECQVVVGNSYGR